MDILGGRAFNFMERMFFSADLQYILFSAIGDMTEILRANKPKQW